MNVTELKALAKSLNVTGYSRLRKAELIVAIGDATYDDAVTENRTRSVRKVAAGYKRKSYNERMVNRLFGYHTQNGFGHMLSVPEYAGYDSPLMMSKLTPSQRKRYTKKYNRQYGRLVASLNV